MKVTFGTKAETLSRLSRVLKKSIILPQVSFSIEDWVRKQDQILNCIKNQLPGDYPKIIVRSSSLMEDALTQSNAGRFSSIGNEG
ncbi:MAG: hypothetical protein ABIA63_05695, partial [bacterium]